MFFSVVEISVGESLVVGRFANVVKPAVEAVGHVDIVFADYPRLKLVETDVGRDVDIRVFSHERACSFVVDHSQLLFAGSDEKKQLLGAVV